MPKPDVFIASRSEIELSEIYQILMENLLHVSSALTNMEIGMKASTANNTSSSSSTVTTMTTIPAINPPGGGGGGGQQQQQLLGPTLASTNPFKDTVDIITTL